jgi:hypothetical protein
LDDPLETNHEDPECVAAHIPQIRSVAIQEAVKSLLSAHPHRRQTPSWAHSAARASLSYCQAVTRG